MIPGIHHLEQQLVAVASGRRQPDSTLQDPVGVGPERALGKDLLARLEVDEAGMGCETVDLLVG
jgi:hypothetical protein